ncbi:MAG: nucleoside-triphosphatase [Bacillota bacterium]|nr:nucleoside-triphosphatase [Bacillota bacterium]
MKFLICGDINAGKSTLIKKLEPLTGKEPKGYITVRMPDDEKGCSYVYLYDRTSPPEDIRTAAVIMRFAPDRSGEKHPELLDTLGVQYLENIPEGSLVILDEIGTLESASPKFQQAVMKILSGNYDVLASVKAQNTDFLRQVRSHPDCELFIITPGNRDELFEQLKARMGV